MVTVTYILIDIYFGGLKIAVDNQGRDYHVGQPIVGHSLHVIYDTSRNVPNVDTVIHLRRFCLILLPFIPLQTYTTGPSAKV